MAFQVKDFASITASCINWMKATTAKITDFNVGAVVRTMIEAIAAEIDELYQQMFIGIKEAIPVAVYNSFNFSALTATPAIGLVRVSITPSATATLISAGTSFNVTGNPTMYVSTSDVTIAAGSTYGDVPIACAVAGSAGNQASGAAFTVSPAPSGLVSATNLSAIASGTDNETDDDRKVRFTAFVSSLNRGTIAALKYGLQTAFLTDASGNTIEHVATSSVVEPWIADNTQPVGLVNCYIHNGVGSTSGALVAQANKVIYGYYDANGNAVPGWKAAGVNVQVYAATETTVAVTAALTAVSGYDKPTLVIAVTSAINSYLLSLPIGQPALEAEIVTLAMNTLGVANFVMTAPASDVAAAANVKLMPGTFTIT